MMMMSWFPYNMTGTYIRGKTPHPMNIVKRYYKTWYLPHLHMWQIGGI